MWVCYSPRFRREQTGRDTLEFRPRSPSSPTAEGRHTFSWEGRALPAWSHTGCVYPAPFQGLPLSLRPCTVQHTPVTHPRYPEGCWVVSTSGAVRIMLWTLFIALKKQFFSGSQTSGQPETSFTRTLSLFLILYISVSRMHSHKHVRISAGVHQEHITGSQHTHTLSRADMTRKQATGL